MKNKVKNQPKKAWSGRFEKASHPLLEKFNASLPFDKKLYREDIQGSMAHARMLAKIKILTKEEVAKIENGLKEIKAEIEAGKFEWSDALEDIHMAIETRLTEKIGPLGGKLHTARSRNDQVALDLRLYCRRVIAEISNLLTQVQSALVELAQTKGLIPLPGYTHLQRAQPVLMAHHLLAYFEMLKRDKMRLHDTLARTEVSPLGSGALSGTPYPLDREFVADQLGLQGVTHNSLDAVSDRDFAAELLFNLSLIMAHLSRFAEELILWSSQEFSFIKLPEEFCTGSSMMPQKVNPDAPELIRGKTGRVYGNLIALLTTLKGLPLAYNKDLQEDKEPLFDSVETVTIVLQVLAAMIPGIEFHPTEMRDATAKGFLLATDLADYLATKGIAFREAHEISGHIVRDCIQRKTVLEKLSLTDLRKFSPTFKEDVFDWLDVEKAINRRVTIGGTATENVRRELKRARKSLHP